MNCLDDNCTTELPERPKGKPGPKPKYCDRHIRERRSNQASNARSNSVNTKEVDSSEGELSPCCADWASTGPRRRTCPQHQIARRYDREVAELRSMVRGSERHSNASWLSDDAITITDMLTTGHGIRVSRNPDNWWSDDDIHFDKTQDKLIDEWAEEMRKICTETSEHTHEVRPDGTEVTKTVTTIVTTIEPN